MPPFNFENSYRKPEEPLPQDIAEVKAHPEMVGFDESAMRRKLEDQSAFEFDEHSELGTMERMAREDEINLSIDNARFEHDSFIEDFEEGVAKYYKEVALRPERSFKDQLRFAYAGAMEQADIAKKLFEQLQYKKVPCIELQSTNFNPQYLMYKDGVFTQVDFICNDGIIDLNQYGFPGIVKYSTLVLNNNAGEIPVSEYGNREGSIYEIGSKIKTVNTKYTRKGVKLPPEWDEYPYKECDKKVLTLDEVKSTLAHHPGFFKELFDQIKAQANERVVKEDATRKEWEESEGMNKS